MNLRTDGKDLATPRDLGPRRSGAICVITVSPHHLRQISLLNCLCRGQVTSCVCQRVIRTQAVRATDHSASLSSSGLSSRSGASLACIYDRLGRLYGRGWMHRTSGLSRQNQCWTRNNLLRMPFMDAVCPHDPERSRRQDISASAKPSARRTSCRSLDSSNFNCCLHPPIILDHRSVHMDPPQSREPSLALFLSVGLSCHHGCKGIDKLMVSVGKLPRDQDTFSMRRQTKMEAESSRAFLGPLGRAKGSVP